MSPRYIGPYEIIEKLNPIAYRSDLQAQLKHILNVLCILQLKKYVSDPNHVIETEPVEVAENLGYRVHLKQILDCRIKQHRNKASF